MIERYSRKEIKKIWDDFNRYSIWLEIELAAAEAMEKLKIIPRGVAKKVRTKAKINPKRILQIEEKVKHDIIAFLTSITEKVGKEAKCLHKGMTSSDVLDTCFNLQLKQSGEILLRDIDELLISIKQIGVKISTINLSVGAGTFQPVKVENIKNHDIHEEYLEVSREVMVLVNQTKQAGKKVFAVGTTATRALETALASFRL